MTTATEAAAWWGAGPAPTDRWPGVTIPIDDGGGQYRFDETKATRVCNFFPRFCSHSKGAFAGQQFDLLDYQTQLILRPIFGWVRPDGTRRFRKAYIEIPKKNGKTQLIAGLALYMLVGDQEPGAEVYVAAADRDQARILFSAAKSMVEGNPALSKRLICYQNSIARRDDPSAFFKVLSAEAATKHGPNIHCLIIDELHAQPDRELFETLTRGTIARRQPLTLLITTAGDDDESICFEEYEYAKRVLNGAIQDAQHLPVIFEAAPDDDWLNPSIWGRVNPGLGFTIQADALEGFAREAANEPRKRNDFLRYHLNRWVNQATAWLPVEWWDACDATEATAYRRWLAEQVPALSALACTAGLDMAQKIDLACFCVVCRHPLEAVLPVQAVGGDLDQLQQRSLNINYQITLVPFFWIPRDTMRKREQEDGVPYAYWESLGLVTPTDGVMIDYDRIVTDITTKIVPMFPRLRQSSIGYDPAFASDIAQRLRKFAGRDEWCLEVLQNYSYLSEPSYIFEALVQAGRVRHGGHRVLRNHVEHVAIKTDEARRIRPVKPKKSGKHIDGVVAGLMGLKLLSGVPDTPSASTGVFFV